MRKITEVRLPTIIPKRKRVAAYARVSVAKQAMLDSLAMQVSYYNKYITSRHDWEFVGVYADEGITGTKENRPDFQRLLDDCRAQKIDMVITKSISRFARNTVTLLATIRELKLLGIDIFFERENIHTISPEGELMLTLLATFAQEESRSASENQKWRIRKKFEQGLLSGGCFIYGYQLLDGELIVVPEEAKVVQQIYRDYLSGKGMLSIVKKLNAACIPTKFEKRWNTMSIYRILRNEKYAGDLLLQKKFVKDHLTKKEAVNHGELPQYLIRDCHEAIIEKDTFKKVQDEIQRRAAGKESIAPKSDQYPFSSRVTCEQCGKSYRRKTASAGSKYAKPIWICSTFNTLGKDFCPAQQIPENILIAKTMEVLEIVDYDETCFKQAIAHKLNRISIPGHHCIHYHFKDGNIVETTWENPSRNQSWTPEMRAAAREKRLSRIRKEKKYD